METKNQAQEKSALTVSTPTLPTSIAAWWAITKTSKSVNTEVQCARSGIPSLRLMQRQYGQEQMIDFLVMQINSLNKLLNVEHIMDVDTAIFAAESILDEFGLLNLADIRLVFTRAIRGQYGQFYNRITIPQMMDWFRKYFENRWMMCAMASENESMQNKETDSRTSPEVLNLLKNKK